MSNSQNVIRELKLLQEHCSKTIAAGGAYNPVTYSELEYLAGLVAAGFSALGLDKRVNSLGQAHAPKKGWELHG